MIRLRDGGSGVRFWTTETGLSLHRKLPEDIEVSFYVENRPALEAEDVRLVPAFRVSTVVPVLVM